MKKFDFAELTKEQIELIETLEIGEHFISEEHCIMVKEALELEGKTEKELRAIRNSCVRHLSDKFEEVREDFKAGSRMLTNTSGITAVIDSQIWKIGSEV